MPWYVPHPLYDNFGNKVSRREARLHLGIESDGPIILIFRIYPESIKAWIFYWML
jgi:hypothetical protein